VTFGRHFVRSDPAVGVNRCPIATFYTRSGMDFLTWNGITCLGPGTYGAPGTRESMRSIW